MRLDEAKEILKYNGYILEDTETNDEEIENLSKKLNNTYVSLDPKTKAEKRARNKYINDLNTHDNLLDKHDDLKNKIRNAKDFNRVLDVDVDKEFEQSTELKEYLSKIFDDSNWLDFGNDKDYLIPYIDLINAIQTSKIEDIRFIIEDLVDSYDYRDDFSSKYIQKIVNHIALMKD